MIGTSTPIANRQTRVTLWAPGVAVPDGDGGYTQTESALTPPALFAFVRPVTAADLERVAGATTLATATHLVSVPYHAGITTETVLHLDDPPRPGRVLKVVALSNPDERNADLDLVCAEQIR